MANDLPEPASRKEQFLAKAAGENVELPTPASREELYLNAIANNGGGGGGDTVYSDKSTSNSPTGGAVYIGNLDSSQAEQADPTSTDNHYKYLWALPYDNSETPQENSINIFGQRARANSIVIGYNASDSSNTSANTNILIGRGTHTSGNTARNVVIGNGAFSGSGALDCVCIGRNANTNNYISRSVAIGSNSYATRTGEVNIGESTGSGYNNTNYRVLGGVHDGQLANDAVTVGQINALIDAINSATSSNISHIGS